MSPQVRRATQRLKRNRWSLRAVSEIKNWECTGPFSPMMANIQKDTCRPVSPLQSPSCLSPLVRQVSLLCSRFYFFFSSSFRPTALLRCRSSRCGSPSALHTTLWLAFSDEAQVSGSAVAGLRWKKVTELLHMWHLLHVSSPRFLCTDWCSDPPRPAATCCRIDSCLSATTRMIADNGPIASCSLNLHEKVPTHKTSARSAPKKKDCAALQKMKTL